MPMTLIDCASAHLYNSQSRHNDVYPPAKDYHIIKLLQIIKDLLPSLTSIHSPHLSYTLETPLFRFFSSSFSSDGMALLIITSQHQNSIHITFTSNVENHSCVWKMKKKYPNQWLQITLSNVYENWWYVRRLYAFGHTNKYPMIYELIRLLIYPFTSKYIQRGSFVYKIRLTQQLKIGLVEGQRF